MLKNFAVGNSRGRIFKEFSHFIKNNNEFASDVARIISSASFRRLQYKTQVFVNYEGDHYRTRLTHSLEVAKIARVICYHLGLNSDLSEAISLAHDMGHAPFGHAGEDALAEMMKNYGGFSHNLHSIHILTELEDYVCEYKGLNLTYETLDGIIKHNGALEKSDILYKKAIDLNLDPELSPSLEGQIAALADDIAYNHHDLEDGYRAEFLGIKDLRDISLLSEMMDNILEIHPSISDKQLVSMLIKKSANLMIEDLIDYSYKYIIKNGFESSLDIKKCKDFVMRFSPEISDFHKKLKSMLFNKVYRHYKVNRMTNKAGRIISELFKLYFENPNCLPINWQIKLGKEYDDFQLASVVKDFIACMTDRYATKEYLSFFDVKFDSNMENWR